MKETLEDLMDAARARSDYADVRHVHTRQEAISTRNGAVDEVPVTGDDVQVRSYPSSHTGDVKQAGYEHLAALDLAENGPRVAEEAIALLTAPQCEPGRTTIVLDGQQLALQVHESVGHAV